MKKLKKYFNNQLTEQEDEKITEALLTNYFDQELKERWNKKLKENYSIELPQKKISKRISLVWKLSAAAAVFLLLFGFFKIYQPSSNLEHLVAQHLSTPYPELSTRKGLNIQSIRIKASNAYTSGMYKNAIENYNKIIVADSSTIDDYFYLGLSHLYLNQSSSAIPLFQIAMDLPLSVYIRDKEPIQWFLSLAYIKNQQLNFAEKELQKLIKEKPSPKIKKQAIELLSEIKTK